MSPCDTVSETRFLNVQRVARSRSEGWAIWLISSIYAPIVFCLRIFKWCTEAPHYSICEMTLNTFVVADDDGVDMAEVKKKTGDQNRVQPGKYNVSERARGKGWDERKLRVGNPELLKLKWMSEQYLIMSQNEYIQFHGRSKMIRGTQVQRHSVQGWH